MVEEKGFKNIKEKKRIGNTKLINQMLEDYNNGYEIDYDPFGEHDIDLRAENVPFDYTDEEVEEMDKCYNDPIYFMSKYCKGMTDWGYKTVELRNFQKDLIKIVTAQDYDPELKLLLPKNRNIIGMAARQSGKCLNFNQLVNIKDKKTLSESKTNFIYKFGNKYKNKNVLYYVKMFLYKIYSKL